MINDYNKYMDQMCQKYPYLSKKVLQDIIKHGLYMYYYVISRNADVYMGSNKHDIHTITGRLYKDNLKDYLQGVKKRSFRIRMNKRYRKIKYTGYYYFGMNYPNNKKFLKKIITGNSLTVYLKRIFFYKYIEEVYDQKQYVAVYRIKIKEEKGVAIYNKYNKHLKRNIELIDINNNSAWYKRQQILLAKE